MGSSTPPSTTQSTTTTLSPQQKALYDTAFPFAQQYASQPLQQFQGSGIAPLSPEELQAQSQYRTQAAPVAQGLATAGANAQSKLLDPSFMLDPAHNPYLIDAANATKNVVNQGLTEQVLPSIHSGATAAGGMYSGGNTREGIAQGEAIGRTNQALSNTIADQMFGAYKTGLAGMQGAVQGNAGVMGQQTMPGDILAAVGGQNRAQEQAGLDEQIQRFYTGQALPYMQAQELFALLNGMPGATTTSTGTGALPQGPSPIMAGLGGAASGAAVGSLGGPMGTGIGAAAGGGLGLLASLMQRR